MSSRDVKIKHFKIFVSPLQNLFYFKDKAWTVRRCKNRWDIYLPKETAAIFESSSDA